MVEKWQFLKLKFSVFFFQNWKTQLSKNIGIYVIAFDPIEIQTQQAPQNDRQNLSFVKDTNVVGNRMTRNGPKMTNSKGCLFNFWTDFSLQKLITPSTHQSKLVTYVHFTMMHPVLNYNCLYSGLDLAGAT